MHHVAMVMYYSSPVPCREPMFAQTHFDVILCSAYCALGYQNTKNNLVHTGM